jgi:hypothetical protein
MRSKWYLPATSLAVLLTAATAPAQTIAYINLLQFDLQSFRSQATAGIFQDDVDMVADAANLTEIEGNRLFTNFANLNEPALLGDNIITYSADHNASPYFGGSSSDVFDSGSYLVGWIGKYSKDSDYSFSTFYQRNSSKVMIEDLEDLQIGFEDLRGGSSGADAEYSGFVRVTDSVDSSGVIDADQTDTFDLTRYDDRNAMNFDFGAARDVSEELTLGGRFFWESDQLDIFSEGRVESVSRSADSSGVLQVDNRLVITWIGNGEEAFKNREIGVSLDAGYHPWENQDVNVRVDVFGTKIVNPGGEFSVWSLPSRGGPYYNEVGALVDLRTDTDYSTVLAGSAPFGLQPLTANHENSNWFTQSYQFGSIGPAVESVDDERTGLGFAAKGQWDREWAGGENRAWVGFSHRGLDVDGTVVEVDRAGQMFWWNNGGSDTQATNTVRDDTRTTTKNGDMSLNTYEIGTRWNRPMNEHVSMGLGAILTRGTWHDEYRGTYTVNEVSGFNDGDAGNNTLYTASGNIAHYEEQLVYHVVETADVDDETRTTTVRLPVGGQFHFGGRYTVNVGAQHTIESFERETKIAWPLSGNLPAVQTYTDVTTPANNTVTYIDPGFEEDHTVTDKGRSNRTTYWYGLSIMLTDAAQLDINGIFETYSLGGRGYYDNPSILDTDFYRNLAVSLKYIFW